MSKEKPTEGGTAVENPPKEKSPGFMERVGGAGDGFLRQVTGGPFGWVAKQCHVQGPRPDPTGEKWLDYFPVDDGGPDASDETPGGRKKGRGAAL